MELFGKDLDREVAVVVERRENLSSLYVLGDVLELNCRHLTPKKHGPA